MLRSVEPGRGSSDSKIFTAEKKRKEKKKKKKRKERKGKESVRLCIRWDVQIGSEIEEREEAKEADLQLFLVFP